MKLSGGQALMESLIKQGVDIIFGYPGGAIMPIYDALYDYEDRLKHVLVRHEQGAAHAAEGYARITGRPGVAFATSGPGATNLVTGIADAMLDSIPMVCITGQVAEEFIGTDAFQETDVIGITTPITKWNYQITNAAEIPEIVQKAFIIASEGRPGPVLIDITKNAQSEIVDFDLENIEKYKYPHPTPSLDHKVITLAAKLINDSKNPIIFTGHGVLISNAENELIKLAETADIPVASTLHGLSSFPTSHPLYAGMLGMHGNYGPNILSNKADVIIAVGMRFDDRVTGKLDGYLKNVKVIHIDIDPAELGKNIRPEVEINFNAKEALAEINKKIVKNSHPKWTKQFKDAYQEEYEKVIEEQFKPSGEMLKMAEVINMISEKTKGDAVIVADVGQHQMMAARYYKFKKPNSFITSGGLGTMGFALPASIGAKFANPKREVIAIVGDGSFQMNIQELATINQEKLAVKIVILNNEFLGMVRQWQQLFFEKRYSFTTLINPDFVKVAEGFYINAELVQKREELSAAVDRMLNSDSAYLLDIRVGKEDNVFPMVPTGMSVDDVRLS